MRVRRVSLLTIGAFALVIALASPAVAGHRAIADAMQFADHSEVELERLQSERALEAKRNQHNRA